MSITKNHATAVRRYLGTLGITISHVQALEVIARGTGHRSRHAVPRKVAAPIAANELPPQLASFSSQAVEDSNESPPEVDSTIYCILTRSDCFGDDLFKYDSEVEREDGLKRLLSKAVSLQQEGVTGGIGVIREYYFADIVPTEDESVSDLLLSLSTDFLSIEASVGSDGSVWSHHKERIAVLH